MPKRATAVRQRILEAGVRVFSERGYDATTTRHIAVAAHCGEPSVYRLFGSKAKLFREVLEYVFHVYEPPKIDTDVELSESIAHVVEQVFVSWNRSPHALRLFYWAGLSNQRAARKVVQAVIDKTFAPVIEAIRKRQAFGQYRLELPPVALAEVFLGMVNYDFLIRDLMRMERIAGEPYDREAYIRTIVAVILDGARTRGE